jgi:ribosomal protein L18
MINIASMRGAADEFSVQTDNASLAQSMSQMQADNLRLAGDTGLRMAQKAAKRGVMSAVVKGGLMGASSGGFTGNSTQSLVSAPGYGPVVPT